jgi:hypothetical protein
MLGDARGEPAPAGTLGGELKRFLYDDAVAHVHVRSFFMDRLNPAPPNNAAWAGGGWVGLETGWLYDAIRFGAVGYTTQPLWAPADTDGTQLLKTGQYGFFVLGQAYASIRAGDHAFTGFRQMIDELEVNPNDDRMVPITFEAYALRGRFGAVSYFAGYVAAIKPKDYWTFINMGERAGAPNVNAGMALASLTYGRLDDLRLRVSTYHVPDILTSSYVDIARTLAVSDGVRVRFSAQGMLQESNGSDRLTGTSFSTFAAGGRLDVLWGALDLWGVYTEVGRAAAYRAPYGQWIGYTKQMTRDFNRAGERAWQVGLTYDLASVGMDGLTFLGSATLGSYAVNADSDAALSRNNEYDIDAIYQVAGRNAPDWLKPLQLRGRFAYVDQFLNASVTSVTEYRLILNYEVKLKAR